MSRPWNLRLVGLAIALAAGIVLTSCGGGENGAAGRTSATDEAGAAQNVSVGVVTDIGGLNDRGFNELMNRGMQRAIDELGVEGRLLESQADTDYIPNLSSLAESGADIIFAAGFLLGQATHTAADNFPDASFAIIDFSYGGPDCESSNSCELPNLQGLLFREQEVGYLAGYLAALVTSSGIERTNDKLVISTVGGQSIPPVDRFIAGFQKGARDANPQVTTLNAYSQDFSDQAKCKEIALDQIARGSDVVFQVAGGCGLGALDAAKEKGAWGIGVDQDQAFLGDHVLTSAVKRADVAVFETVKAIVEGTFTGGGASLFNLENDGVGLGTMSPAVPESITARVEEQKQKIIAGEIEIPETVG